MNKKITIITGAGQGIGKFIATNLDNKSDLLLISKTSNCKKVSKKINIEAGFEKSKFVKIDLQKNISLDKTLKRFNLNYYSEVNLILCAAIVDKKANSFYDYNEWVNTFNVNFFSNINFINYFIKRIKKNKSKKIIIFSGGGAANSFKEFPIYSASKTALVRTVENYANKFKRINLNIFAVAPGAIKTKMLNKVEKIAKVKTKSKIIGVFHFVNFCLNNNTNYFNGKLIHIRDSIKKIKNNNDINYLKLRRVE